MIKVSNVNLNYSSDKILDDISYTFEKGKIYGLIGKNGSGKTSFLKTIVRLNRKSTGDIILNEIYINDLDYLKIPISFIGDTPVYYPDLTVKEHLLLICNIKKFSKKIALEKIDELLNLLKLKKYTHSFPNSLSRGTLQRLNIAMGIIRDEDIILMDEPFITLDPVQVTTVENLILKLKNENKTFLISSHDIDSLESICDIYLILKDGKFLEYRPDELDKNCISNLISDSYGD